MQLVAEMLKSCDDEASGRAGDARGHGNHVSVERTGSIKTVQERTDQIYDATKRYPERQQESLDRATYQASAE